MVTREKSKFTSAHWHWVFGEKELGVTPELCWVWQNQRKVWGLHTPGTQSCSNLRDNPERSHVGIHQPQLRGNCDKHLVKEAYKTGHQISCRHLLASPQHTYSKLPSRIFSVNKLGGHNFYTLPFFAWPDGGCHLFSILGRHYLSPLFVRGPIFEFFSNMLLNQYVWE